jgi:hypothetical protein
LIAPLGGGTACRARNVGLPLRRIVPLGGLACAATVDLLSCLPAVVGAAQRIVAIGSSSAFVAVLRLSAIDVARPIRSRLRSMLLARSCAWLRSILLARS